MTPIFAPAQRYGLKYDKLTLHVEPDMVYESGRHHVGLGRRVSLCLIICALRLLREFAGGVESSQTPPANVAAILCLTQTRTRE